MSAGTIRFLINGERRERALSTPARTVLEYLRQDERRTATKEGCAEGDCGACTVVIGEARDGGMRYRAVNSCLVFLPELHGRLLLTAEGLPDAGGQPHPVQAALAEHHATQCGYCTPGFVMAMFAMFHDAPLPDRTAADEALAGNLCRCTGYRPIVDAAIAIAGRKADRFSAAEADLARTLAELRAGTDAPPSALTRQGGYAQPRSLDAALDLLAEHPEAHLLAGGTDLGLLVTKHFRALPFVISLARIGELREIEETSHAIRIGAGVTYTDALAVIERAYPSFGRLIRRIGSVQIRNLGTIGGNVANASPIGDSLPPLLALGASLELRSRAGRRQLPIAEFFIDYRRTARRPDEIVTRIELPKPAPDEIFRAYKVSKRHDQDISTVCAAFNLRLDGGKVASFSAAFGGMAAIPKRASALEAAVTGQPWTDATVEPGVAALAQDFAPLSDFRGSADYRRLVAGNLLRRFLLESRGVNRVALEVHPS